MALRSTSQDTNGNDKNDQLNSDHTPGEWSLFDPNFDNSSHGFETLPDWLPVTRLDSFDELQPSNPQHWSKDPSLWTIPSAEGPNGLSRTSSFSSDVGQAYNSSEIQYAHLGISATRAGSQQSLADASSCGADFSADEGPQMISCWECNKIFANLRTLDKHTQATLHKAWRCSGSGCGKTYARRDTFLRHRSTHKESSHWCVVCLKNGKQKVFKRKDHLREHMRNCHPKSIEGTRPNRSDRHPTCDPAVECGVVHTLVAAENKVSVSQEQQQAMKDIVKSLGTVLGNRHANVIDKLGNKLTTMSGQDLKSIAESMAVSALAKTYFTAPDACDHPKDQ